jgi:uncharacterized membrane protein
MNSKRRFFSVEEESVITAAIREVEQKTSGEVRVFVEEFCPENALDRVVKLFFKNNMQITKYRNGVLIYLAWGTRELAIWGDEGIHNKVGGHFWLLERDILRNNFQEKKYVEGLCQVIAQVGAQLENYFPHEADDKNELPDEIIYG